MFFKQSRHSRIQRGNDLGEVSRRSHTLFFGKYLTAVLSFHTHKHVGLLAEPSMYMASKDTQGGVEQVSVPSIMRSETRGALSRYYPATTGP